MKAQRTLVCDTQDRVRGHVGLPELLKEECFSKLAQGLRKLLRPGPKLEFVALRHSAPWVLPEHGQRDRLGPPLRAPAELSG
jgi:hypothetical protein